MRSKVTLLSLIVAFAAICFPPAALAINGGSEIPGAPLPSSQFTSEVGGAVVDQVWRLNLTHGRIALIRVDGEPGAELGLYLFGSEATSVVTSTPLKSSAQPGATQVITASLPPGTYYVNVNGRNRERAYSFTITTSLYVDLTAPVLEARFPQGFGNVSTDYVDIEPQATDLLSGITQFRYRIDSNDWGDWDSYSPLVRIHLASEERRYRVDIQVKNGVGLLSAISTLYATVDRTAPDAVLIRTTENDIAFDARPIMSIKYSEPMNPKSVATSFSFRELSGNSLAAECKYFAKSTSATCRPNADLKLGQSYLLEHSGARDLAGNLSNPIAPQTLTYYKKTSLYLTLSQSVHTFGGVLFATIRTSGVPDQTKVILQSRTSESSEWTNYGLMRVLDGSARFVLTPNLTTEYRAIFLGSQFSAPSASSVRGIIVKPSMVVYRPIAKSLTRTRGTLVRFAASVGPVATPAKLVTLRCNRNYSDCTIQSEEESLPDASGRINWTWKAKKGYWKFRVTTSPQNGLSSSISAPIRVIVP